MVLLAAGFSAVGLVFSNVVILAIASFLLVFVLVDGVVFHRSIIVANQYLTVQTNPQEIRCKVGERVEVENTIANHSSYDLSITGLTFSPQDQFNEQREASGTSLLAKHGMRVMRTRFEARVPGRFEIQAVKVNLTSRANMFNQSIWAPNSTVVIARPTISLSGLADIDSSLLDDLTPDRIRRGTGTDLAGIRPSAYLDDLHRVDWKSTARTGKIMVKEFHLERQPPVIFVIDFSGTMRAKTKGEPIFDRLLATLPNLLSSFRPATPIGLLVYDEKSIITDMPARVGEHQRALVIDALLGRARRELNLKSNFHVLNESSPNASVSSIERYQYRNTFNPDFVPLRWLYTDARLRHRERLNVQGAYMALARLNTLSNSSLIIAVTDGKTNLNGLVEGARLATSSGHRVILVILIEYYQRIPTSYIFAGLRDRGIRMQECFPEELPALIEAEIARMSHERLIPHNA